MKMSKSSIGSDLKLIFNGLKKVISSGIEFKLANAETIVKNSSLKKTSEEAPQSLKQSVPGDFQNALQRASMVPKAIKEFATVAPKLFTKPLDLFSSEARSSTTVDKSDKRDEEILIREEDLEAIYIRSLGVEILQQNEDGKIYEAQMLSNEMKKQGKDSESVHVINTMQSTSEQPTKIKSPTIIKQAEDARKAINDSRITDEDRLNNAMYTLRGNFINDPIVKLAMQETLGRPKLDPKTFTPIKKTAKPFSALKPLSKKKPTSQLAKTSKERKVPATRMSRLVSYGGLAAGLGLGALSEITKRSLGLKNTTKEGNSLMDASPFLTEANAERIVDTLCRVRGAALKIGQILSIQDNTMINPQLQRVFERVRHSADFMPKWQMEKMMVTEFGSDWSSNLLEFDTKPFAAASIGQVHLGKLHDGRPVAIKIQYPGVAEGIESDIDNLMSVLNVWNILPEGIFIDSIISVAKRELGWEVNYIREAECAKRFRKLLEPHPDYYVPEVIDSLTTHQIYTTELIEGMAVDKCENLDQDTRDRICFLMLDLFFRELFEFRFMQTDPNWSNFLYNVETKQIGLLDFGASRDYSKTFVDKYMIILKGAAENDYNTVLEYSQKIGFLTGYESKTMEAAHMETVMTLSEAFRIGDNPYDFGRQDLTSRIHKLVPVMVKERLCPPPEEVYSLHRKLSGVFLLCAKLGGRVQCRPIFDRVCENYKVDTDLIA